MKRLTIPLLAASALAVVAAPAAAQPWGYGGGHDRGARLEERIQRGEYRGRLTRWEADSLRRQLYGVRRLEAHYWRTRGGIDPWEARDLEHRYDQLQARLRWERRDGDRYRRGGGYYRY